MQIEFSKISLCDCNQSYLDNTAPMSALRASLVASALHSTNGITQEDEMLRMANAIYNEYFYNRFAEIGFPKWNPYDEFYLEWNPIYKRYHDELFQFLLSLECYEGLMVLKQLTTVIDSKSKYDKSDEHLFDSMMDYVVYAVSKIKNYNQDCENNG